MSLTASKVLILSILCYGLGFWCAFHIPQTLHELDVFRQFVVRKVTGEVSCPHGYTCQPNQ